MRQLAKPPRFFFIFLQGILLSICLNSGKEITQSLSLNQNLINLNSNHGEAYLLESDARADYLPLMLYFVSQDNLAYCGVASMVMVLNALEVPAPLAPEYRTFRIFTQDNVFNNPKTEAVISAEKVTKMGMTLEQLAQLLASYSLQTEIHHGADVTLGEFRQLIIENLQQKNNFVLVNYLRSAIDQERGGHISPVAAYHQDSDRVLILDVARYKYPPVWVKIEELWQATRTRDSVSGKTRGLVLVDTSPATVKSR